MNRMATSLVALVVVSAATAAQAEPRPDSGLLLGVYAYENWRGLVVTGTIPGYAADGRLFPRDVLTRVSDGVNIYSVGTSADIEYAKDQIGPYRNAALEVYRPGFGYIYLWVEFQPVGGGVHAYVHGDAPRTRMKAMIKTETERAGAREFFHGQRPGATGGDQGRQGGFPSAFSNGAGRLDASDPASFFHR